VDPRAGLDDVEKIKFLTLPGLELQPLSGPSRSQSLYRLRYPGFSRLKGVDFMWVRVHWRDVCLWLFYDERSSRHI
jgi:hypothetical protein